jgi:hypothetical protein
MEAPPGPAKLAKMRAMSFDTLRRRERSTRSLRRRSRRARIAWIVSAVLLEVACGGGHVGPTGAEASRPRHRAAPRHPTPSAALPRLTSRKVTLHLQAGGLVYAAGGRLLLVSRNDTLELVDPIAGTSVSNDSIRLSSASAPSPFPPPHDRRLSSEIAAATWAWDDARGGVLGGVQVQSTGRLPGGVGLWDPGSGALPQMLTAKTTLCQPLAISPDRTLFLATSTDAKWCQGSHAVQAFALPSGTPVGPPVDTGHVDTAAFAPDGRTVALGSSSGALYLYQPVTGAITRLPRPEGASHLDFHPRLPLLLASSSSGVHVFRLDDLDAAPITITGEPGLAAFSPDGRYLAVVSDRELVLFDPVTLARETTPLAIENTFQVSAIAFSPDARQLAIAIDEDLTLVDLPPASAAGASPPMTAPLDLGWYAKLQPLPVPEPLPPPPIERDGALRGRVLADGKPCGGAEVRLSPHHDNWPDAAKLPDMVVRTGKDGRYRFDRVPRILWQESIRAPGRVISGGIADLRRPPEGWGHRDEESTFELHPAATIRGVLLDPRGRPAQGVSVRFGGFPDDVVTTGRDGRFVIDHLRPPTAVRIDARRADGAVLREQVAIERPGPIRWTAHLLAPDAPRVVRLRVVSHAGAPVAGAQVIRQGELMQTDASGRLSFVAEEHEPDVYLSVGARLGDSGTYREVPDVHISLPLPGELTVTLPE